MKEKQSPLITVFGIVSLLLFFYGFPLSIIGGSKGDPLFGMYLAMAIAGAIGLIILGFLYMYIRKNRDKNDDK